MNEDTLKEMLESHKLWLQDGTGNRADLNGADLNGADLNGADLRSADLRRADLHGADLNSADLYGVNFRRADFRSANLRNADLRSADLRSADLRSADLEGADLRSADLEGADFRSANLHGADLSETRGLRYAYCAFNAHGERGRAIMLVDVSGDLTFFCGCFTGSPKKLKEFIEGGNPTLKESRTFAMNFCLEAIKIERK